MTYTLGNAQHIGQRKEQQDSFGFSDFENKFLTSHGGVVGVLADGMGGMAAGKRASSVAVKAFLARYEQKKPDEPILDTLRKSLLAANDAVVKMAHDAGVADETGTTLVAGVILEHKLYWVSAGDSRIYLFRGGRLTQLNTDHIYGHELDRDRAAGKISQTQALSNRDRETLTSYLGIEDLSEIDSNLKPFTLERGDRVLICSDGLYRTLSETDIAVVFNRSEPETVCERLVDAVLQVKAPGQDNVTVLMMAPGEDQVPIKHQAVMPVRVKKEVWLIWILALLCLVLLGLLTVLYVVPSIKDHSEKNPASDSTKEPPAEAVLQPSAGKAPAGALEQPAAKDDPKADPAPEKKEKQPVKEQERNKKITPEVPDDAIKPQKKENKPQKTSKAPAASPAEKRRNDESPKR
jgi:protein phosphatase